MGIKQYVAYTDRWCDELTNLTFLARRDYHNDTLGKAEVLWIVMKYEYDGPLRPKLVQENGRTNGRPG